MILRGRLLALLLVVFWLSACSSGADKPSPTALQTVANTLNIRQSWEIKLGAINYPAQIPLNGKNIAVASSNGQVSMVDVNSGLLLWQLQLKEKIQAGVGNDGKTVALITDQNELLVLQEAQVLWRQRLSSPVYTSPLVAGARVFVQAADRSVSAYDALNGAFLWRYAPTSDPLGLRQSGVLGAVGNTLITGVNGRLLGLDPTQGRVRFEATLATARGVNEIERLVDLVGRFGRADHQVCVRAFNFSVGCIDARNGQVLWTRPAFGSEGIHLNKGLLVLTESSGRVQALNADNGEVRWRIDGLLHRGLTAPLVLGQSVVVGDAQGVLHFLSHQDGSFIHRLSTDGSAFAADPAIVGNALVLLNKSGVLRAFQPE